MNSSAGTNVCFVRAAARWLLAGCALAVLGFLTWFVTGRSGAPDLDTARAALRRQYLAELEETNRVALTTYGWIDSRRGVVRLPLNRAIEMSVSMWQNPAVARSNLLERLGTATAKLPPKPNPYE